MVGLPVAILPREKNFLKMDLEMLTLKFCQENVNKVKYYHHTMFIFLSANDQLWLIGASIFFVN